MTDMTPRPAIDAMFDAARQLAWLASRHANTPFPPDAWDARQEAIKRDLYERMDEVSATQWQGRFNVDKRQYNLTLDKVRNLEVQLKELHGMLDEVRSHGVHPLDMLKELIRSYRAKPIELANMQRKLDGAATAHTAMKDRLKTIADGLQSKPGYFPLDSNGLAFYIEQLMELSK